MAVDTIGSRIRYARKKRGLSGEALGRILDVRHSAISRWETGTYKNPRRDTLVRIADALEVNLNWLLTGEGMMERSPVRAITESPGVKPMLDLMRRTRADMDKLTPPNWRDLSRRIKYARKAHKLSQAAFARKLGVGSSLVSRWESGARTPDESLFEKLAAALGVRLRWLCTGEGEMKLSETEQIIERLKHGEIPSKELTPAPIRWIPILGIVPGGNPFAPEVVPLGNVAVAADAIRHPGAFALQVRGNSMAPAVQDGDQVACEPYEGEHLAPGAMVVALVQGETALKFYVRRGDQHLLISADSSIPPIVLAEGDLILARAVSVIKAL